ncbi:MAG: hypothetical protein IPN95_01940 [Bacteroidetes bacterium]|nr:hypothetical protein [Bacteroidota bacterium]
MVRFSDDLGIQKGPPGNTSASGMLRNGKLLTGYGLKNDFTFGCGLYTLKPMAAYKANGRFRAISKLSLKTIIPDSSESRAPEAN